MYPDYSEIILGATETNLIVDSSLFTVKIRIDSILTICKKMNITDSMIETNFFSVEKEYKFRKDSDTSIFTGFKVVHRLQIKVPIESTNEFLSACFSIGTNIVESLSFGINYEDSLKAEASKIALNNATNQAKSIAKSSGRKLGKLIAISHEMPDENIFAPKFYLAARSLDFHYAASQALQIRQYWPKIIPQKVKVQAKIYTIFKLK